MGHPIVILPYPTASVLIFFEARMLTIVQCRPPLGAFVVLKHDLNYKASNPPTNGHSEPDPHQCTMKDELYVMRKQFSVGLQFPS
jgi:hypothetical protein